MPRVSRDPAGSEEGYTGMFARHVQLVRAAMGHPAARDMPLVPRADPPFFQGDPEQDKKP